jgi:molybdopterin-binding protein
MAKFNNSSRNINKGEIMAIHIKDIDEAVRIIRDTRKVITKLDTIVSVSELQRLSARIDRFLQDIEE